MTVERNLLMGAAGVSTGLTPGTIFVSNPGSNTVSKITPAGVVTEPWAAAIGTGASSIAIDNSGNVYTANANANTVSKITPAGVVTAAWATVGTNPQGIAIDSSGNVYTANNSVGTVSKITPAGVVTTTWATVGTGPRGIAIDSSGNVYTANFTAAKVSKITPGGVVTLAWASLFTNPQGIAIDSSNNVYITNPGSNTVSKITPAGVVTEPWATVGSNPIGIAIYNPITPTAPAAPTIGTATVASATSATVAFTPNSNGGSPITSYTVTSSPGGITATGTSSPITVPGLTTGTSYTFTVTATNAIGTSAPSAASNAIAAFASGYIFAAGVGAGSIYKAYPLPGSAFASLSAFGQALIYNNVTKTLYTLSTSGNFVVIADGSGSTTTITALTPNAGVMAQDSSGNVYFQNATNFDIRKIAPNTSTSSILANSGSLANALVCDTAGNVYVLDNTKITKITPAGVVTATWATVTGTKMVIDTSNNIYVLDGVGNKIGKVTSAGAVTATWASLTAGGNYNTMAIDTTSGIIYVGSPTTNFVSKVLVSTAAVTMNWKSASATGPIVSLTINPTNGDILAGDNSNNSITQITSAGVITLNYGLSSVIPQYVAVIP
jgi:hypothetical protein